MKDRLRQRIVVLIVMLMSLMMTASVAFAADGTSSDPYHILFISSYSYSWGTVPLQIDGLEKALEGKEYVINYEFMDTKNTNYSEGYKEFYDLLSYKMSSRYPYDGIVVGDDAALIFAEEYRETLFKDTPIVFLGVDNVENGEAAYADPLITGVVEQPDYQKNINLAKKLMPQATKISFILDNKENGIGIAEQLEKEKDFFADYDIDYVNTSLFTRKQLCEKLASFDKDTIVFFISMGQQSNGIPLTENERFQIIRDYASAPLFRLAPVGVGDGALGGYVVDFEKCGEIAGKMIIDMLDSKGAVKPELRYDTPGKYMFDYNIMKKYNLDFEQLPQEAIIINEPVGVLQKYSHQIIISLLFILLLTAVVFLISVNKSQKRIEEKNKELMIASNAKTDFLSRMSHDMRTPMNGILGLTNLLHDRTDPKDIKHDIDQIEQSGKYLLSLINDTLDMSKIEAGKMELKPAPINSENLFENIIMTAHLLAAQKNVKLVCEFPPIEHGKWVSVMADQARVEQVFLNIISNAIKFTPSGGKVTLHMDSISITDDEVVDQYIVTDTGIGMSDEFQKHLFEPFSQESREESRGSVGSGLGLAIVNQLVSLMGGTIAVESKLNEGTKFTIVLHYKRYHGELKQVEKPQIDCSILKDKKILLCEDHPINAEITIRLLEQKGVTIKHAVNGQIGLEMFATSPEHYYDAVIMDIRMPVMNGIESAKAMRALSDRADAKTVPIIAMTANAFDSDVEETREAGMNAHLAKPIDPELMFRTLSEQIIIAEQKQLTGI